MALGAFQVLENIDPETVKVAVEAHEDSGMAALWFTCHIGSLGGKTSVGMFCCRRSGTSAVGSKRDHHGRRLDLGVLRLPSLVPTGLGL